VTRGAAASTLAVLLSLISAGSPAAAQPPESRALSGQVDGSALWAWYWDSPDDLAAFVDERGFSRVYLYCQGGFGRRVTTAIRALASSGVEVEALGGEQRWATTQRPDMLRFVRSAVRYQRDASPGARLAGIHLDVEPYDLHSWQHDARGTARSLVRSLSAARRAAGRLPLAADIPFWFDTIGTGGRATLAEAVMRSTDAATVMAYRDAGADVIDVARQEVRIAGRLGKPVTIGVETAEVGPEQVTFFEEGRAALEVALTDVESEFASDTGFGGVAVHHYESLRSLPNG
jgi:hypothetical protein